MKYIALVAALLASPAMAQVVAPAPASPSLQTVAVLEPVQQVNVLRAGAEIPLITREELTTKEKKLRVGQRVQMEVASAVIHNGVIVVPAGTPAVAEITEVRNKGMWGKSGYVGARVLSMRLGDRQIRLSGTFNDKGVTGTGGVVAAIAFIPIAGFLTTGTSAMIPSGAGVKAFLDEDISFRTAAVAPQVITIPVAATAAPAPATVTPSNAPLATVQTAVATTTK